MTYERRVYETAHYMAGNEPRGSEGRCYVDYMSEAIMSVDLQAKAVKEALTMPYLDHVISKEFVEHYLKINGYTK